MDAADFKPLVALFSLQKPGKHPSWIVLDIDYALLHRNDGVIGDTNMLWADLGTALGDVAHAKAMLFLSGALAILKSI